MKTTGKYIKIYIWEPKGDGKFGHISMEGYEEGKAFFYISLWPSAYTVEFKKITAADQVEKWKNRQTTDTNILIAYHEDKNEWCLYIKGKDGGWNEEIINTEKLPEISRILNKNNMEKLQEDQNLQKKIINILTKKGYARSNTSRYGVVADFVESFEDDKEREDDRDPDHVFEFHYVDVDILEKEFEAIRDNKQLPPMSWSLAGSSLIAPTHTLNCIGIVTYLLKKAGFYEIFDFYSRTIRGAYVGALSGFISGGVSAAAYGAWQSLIPPPTIFGSFAGAFFVLTIGAVAGVSSVATAVSLSAVASGTVGTALGTVSGAAVGATVDYFWMPDGIVRGPTAIIPVLEYAKKCEAKYYFNSAEDIIKSLPVIPLEENYIAINIPYATPDKDNEEWMLVDGMDAPPPAVNHLVNPK